MNDTPTWIVIGQAIGGYAALLAAVGAIAAVAVSYRFRPLRMRSIEMHSDQLRRVIQRWRDSIKDPPSPGEPPAFPSHHSYVEEFPTSSKYEIPLEHEILLKDLQNHLSASIIEEWQSYKKGIDAYSENKRLLAQDIIAFMKDVTGLSVHAHSGSLPDEDVLLDSAVQGMFKDIDMRAKQVEPFWFVAELHDSSTELSYEGAMLKRKGVNGLIYCGAPYHGAMGSMSAHLTSEDDKKEIQPQFGEGLARVWYRKLSDEIARNEILLCRMKRHQADYQKLTESRKHIEEQLEELENVPIFERVCDVLGKGV